MSREEIIMPMSVARAEFVASLTDLINHYSSVLPPFAIESILKDMYNDIRLMSQRQLEADKKKYIEQLRANQGEE